MSVKAVYALKRDRSGSIEYDKSQRDYLQSFMVITDDPADGPQVARTAIDPNGGPVIPQPGVFYVAGNDVDLGCYVKRVRAEQEGDSGLIWKVTVDAESFNPDIPKPEPDPTQRPPEVSWDFGQFQRVAEKDVVTGKAIVNSAGQAFDPPIQVDDSRPLYTCERNEASFDPNVAFAYKDAINSDALTLGGLAVAPGQAKMQNISAHREFDNNQFYWAVTYQIAVKDDGWTEQVLDQGRYKLGQNNKLTPCVDDQGNEVTDPVLLNGSGGQLDLPPAAPGNSGAPVYLPFNVYDSLPFIALALP